MEKTEKMSAKLDGTDIVVLHTQEVRMSLEEAAKDLRSIVLEINKLQMTVKKTQDMIDSEKLQKDIKFANDTAKMYENVRDEVQNLLRDHFENVKEKIRLAARKKKLELHYDRAKGDKKKELVSQILGPILAEHGLAPGDGISEAIKAEFDKI